VRYIIEHFTQRPTRGPPTSNNSIDSPFLSFDESKKTVAFKIHGETMGTQEQIAGLLRHNVPLMFLVRNPMEVFPRHMGFEEITPLTSGLSPAGISKGIAYFFENTRTYHSYKGKKQIFYYEDLAKKPEMFIKQLCEFLEVDHSGTKQQEFMKHFNYHFDQSRQIYNRHQKQFVTRMAVLTLTSPLREFTEVTAEQIEAYALDHNADSLGGIPGMTHPVLSLDNGSPHYDLEAALIEKDDNREDILALLNRNPIKFSLDEWCALVPGMRMLNIEIGWLRSPLRFPYVNCAPADFARIHHGSAAIKEKKTLILRIPVEGTFDATQTDGKTPVKYSLNLSKKEQENFWDNFKTLCGSADWRPYERYMDIK